MKKAFEQKVIRERIVDTKNYRYRMVERGYHQYMERIELTKLDTTAAITDWEIVKEYK